MSKDIYRFALRLSPRNTEHVKVIEILEQIPKGRRNAAVCEMILNDVESKDMEAIITAAVQKAIKNTGYTAKKNTGLTQNKTGEVDSDILGFLNSLQKEGG